MVAATPAGYVTVSDDDDEEDDDEPGLRIWHPETGALLREFPDVQGRMLVTSGTTALVCGWSDTPQVVDLTTGRAEALPGHRDIVRDLAFAPSALISAGWDGLVRVTDPGTLSAREFDSGDRLNAVAVTTMGGRRVVLAAGRSLHAFDLDTGSRLPSTPPASGRIDRIAAWSDSYAMLIADGGVELPGGRALSLPPRRYALDLLALTAPDGRRLLALVGDEDVTLWDADTDRPFGAPLLGPTTWPGACVAASGEVITVSPEDRRLAVWQIESGSPERYPGREYRSGLPLSRGHRSTVTCLAVATDGRIIGGGTDGTVGSWSLTDGARGPAVGRITGRPVSAVAVAEVNGEVQVLAGGGDVNGVADDQLHRWPGTPIETGHRGEVKTIVPAGATTVLTSGCDQTIALIDLAAGTPVGTVPGDRFPNGIAVRDGRAAITRFPGRSSCGTWRPRGRSRRRPRTRPPSVSG